MSRSVGEPVRRNEDQRLLTGRGQFSDDFDLPDQAYAVMVRSLWPHAYLKKIDVAVAAAMPGVLGIFTGEDCVRDGLGEIPHDPLPKTNFDKKLHAPGLDVGEPVFIGSHIPLPTDRARYVGEAVAMVVAVAKAQALDAAEAVEATPEGSEETTRCGQ